MDYLASVFGQISKKSKKNTIFCIENKLIAMYNFGMIKQKWGSM